MKKLMGFAAAMALVGGAFADCTLPTETTDVEALVYDFAVTLKTTKAKLVTLKDTQVPCDLPIAGGAIVYRDNGATLKYQGFYWTCDPSCVDSPQFDVPPYTFEYWNTTEKVVLANAVNADVSATAPTWSVLNIIGSPSKMSKVEAAFDTLTWTDLERTSASVANGAGFGTYDSKYNRVKTISGYVVATMAPPYYPHTVGDLVCPPAVAFTPCSYDENDNPTVGYGTWSLKYNASASKKLAKMGQVAGVPALMPSWARVQRVPVELD